VSLRIATARTAPAAVSPAGPAADEVPPEGALEELDGTPIRPPGDGPGAARALRDAAGRQPAVPWWRAAAIATSLAIARPGLWAYALVAFLARGGLLVLAGPIVVLPTIIGISNFVGPASVTAGGPGPRLVALGIAALVAAAAIVVVGTLLAAAAETALHRASVAPADGGTGRSPIAFRARLVPVGLRRGTARVAAIRLVLLVPVLAAVAFAAPSWVAVAYRELTLPSDVTTPLVVRILAGAPAASAAVVVAWLAAEVVGGFAARRAVLLGASWPRALGSGLLDPLRAPVGAVLTIVAALVVGGGALALGVVALAAAWDAVRGPLVDEGLSPAAVAGTLLLVGAWAAALGLAGIAAAVRGTLATAELLRHQPPGPADGSGIVAGPAGRGVGDVAR
jgi:hypothetical protein